MESIDETLARRVWDRVSGGRDTEPNPNQLTALMSQELTDAAALLRLSKILGGQGGALLRLARQCRQNAGYLRGICAILTPGAAPVTAPLPAESSAQATLRRCYVNSLSRMRAYETLSRDPDYGAVFRTMSAAMGKHCASLLELIGQIER